MLTHRCGAEVPRRFWGGTFLFCQGRRLRPYRAETLVSPKFHLRCNLADEGRNSPGNMGRNFQVLPERAESLALRGGDSGPNIFPPHDHHADGGRNFPGSSGPEYFWWGRSLRPPSGISGLGAESPPPEISGATKPGNSAPAQRATVRIVVGHI